MNMPGLSAAGVRSQRRGGGAARRLIGRWIFGRATLAGLAVASLGVSGLAVAGFAVGCQSANRRLPEDVRSTRTEPITVEPEWRDFAMKNYVGVAQADLRAASNIRFLDPPAIAASKNIDNGQVVLMVMGEVDANDIAGHRTRRPFVVSWRKAGSGWELMHEQVDPGQRIAADATTPRDRPMVISPTTAPGTPADPTAAPTLENKPAVSGSPSVSPSQSTVPPVAPSQSPLPSGPTKLPPE